MNNVEFHDRLSVVLNKDATHHARAAVLVYNAAEWWCDTQTGNTYKIMPEKMYMCSHRKETGDVQILRMVVMAVFYNITIMALFIRQVGRYYFTNDCSKYKVLKKESYIKESLLVVAFGYLGLSFIAGYGAKAQMELLSSTLDRSK